MKNGIVQGGLSRIRAASNDIAPTATTKNHRQTSPGESPGGQRNVVEAWRTVMPKINYLAFVSVPS